MVRVRNKVALWVLLTLDLLKNILSLTPRSDAAGRSRQSLQILIKTNLQTEGISIPSPSSFCFQAVSFFSPQAESLFQVETFLRILADPNLSSSVYSTNHKPARAGKVITQGKEKCRTNLSQW